MRIDIHIHHEHGDDLESKVEKAIELIKQTLVKLDEIKILEIKEMATLDQIVSDVAEESTQIDGLSTLTAGLKAQLDAVLAGALTPAQQAQVDAIFSAVEANKAKVVAAINANTPAATPPPTA